MSANAPADPVAQQLSAAYSPIRLESGLFLRRARTTDAAKINALTQPLVEERVLVAKDMVSYFEALQQFRVIVDIAEDGTETLAGCAALHVFWDEIAEVRTVATNPDYRRRGVGRTLITTLLEEARIMGIKKVFCLTFETEFFTSLGFEQISGIPVSPTVFQELLHSTDEGTAEFLDLARVKPNTLGNKRMIIDLTETAPAEA